MQARPRFTHVAIATAIVGALGAVTAFGVAPLAEADIPIRQTVVDALPLNVQPQDAIDRFQQAETIRRGDTLASLLTRIGATDPEMLRFAAHDRTARGILQLRAGRMIHAELDSLGRVHRLAYRLPPAEDDAKSGAVMSRQLLIERTDDQLAASVVDVPLERWVETRSVEIRIVALRRHRCRGHPRIGRAADRRDLRQRDRLPARLPPGRPAARGLRERSATPPPSMPAS